MYNSTSDHSTWYSRNITRSGDWIWPTGVSGSIFTQPAVLVEGHDDPLQFCEGHTLQRNRRGRNNNRPKSLKRQQRFLEKDNSIRQLYQERNAIAKSGRKLRDFKKSWAWAREGKTNHVPLDANQRISADVMGIKVENNSKERTRLSDMTECEYEGERELEDYDYGDYVRRDRSPIKQIYRAYVEEDIPRRNFGDYDPVKTYDLPRSAEIRTSLPLKLANRRVLYKNISSEEEIKVRRMRERKLQQEPPAWYAELNKAYDENLSNISTHEKRSSMTREQASQPYYHHSSSPINSDLEITHSYSRTKLYDETVASSDADEELDFEEGGETDSVPELFLKNHSNYSQRYTEEIDFETKHKMFAEQWYEKEAVKSDAILGTPRGCPEWKLPREDSYVARSRNAEALTSQGTAAGQPSSSWMGYTQGTGFFKAPADTQNPREGELNCTNSLPNVGYQSAEGNLDVRAYDSGFENGRNERQFTDQIYKLNYFYHLKPRPTEEKHGVDYFGYELEFWPNDASDLREVVYGYQMADTLKAKDSVFAAGLMKLMSNKTRNAEIIRQREKKKYGAPLDTSEAYFKYYASLKNAKISSNGGPLKSVVDITIRPESSGHKTETVTQHAQYTSSAPVSREYRGSTAVIKQESAGDRGSDQKDSTEYSGDFKRESYFYQPERVRIDPAEKEEKPPYQPAPQKPGPAKKDGQDDVFRIAIQRCPSIIWDTRRKGGMEREDTRLHYRPGVGYHFQTSNKR